MQVMAAATEGYHTCTVKYLAVAIASYSYRALHHVRERVDAHTVSIQACGGHALARNQRRGGASVNGHPDAPAARNLAVFQPPPRAGAGEYNAAGDAVVDPGTLPKGAIYVHACVNKYICESFVFTSPEATKGALGI